jgi:hypothetical protein
MYGSSFLRQSSTSANSEVYKNKNVNEISLLEATLLLISCILPEENALHNTHEPLEKKREMSTTDRSRKIILEMYSGLSKILSKGPSTKILLPSFFSPLFFSFS